MSAKLTAAACVAIAGVTALLLAGPAGAATYAISGKQVTANEAAGKYKTKGGLVGSWKTTSFKETAKSPLYQAKGTETFNGCLDVKRDHSCAGDPSGTIKFRFLYGGEFGAGDSLVWGSC